LDTPAGADGAGIDQLAAVVLADQERAVVAARVPRRVSATADHELLAVEAFDLQPILGPARVIGCRGALGDDPFQVELAGLLEEDGPWPSTWSE
jgi:hypothetical protein